MIYLRSSVGVEMGRDDLLFACLQSNFAAGVFTHFKRVRDFRSRDKAEVQKEIDAFFKSNRLDRESVVLGIPRGDVIVRHLDLPAEVVDNLKQVVQYQVQSLEPNEEEKYCYDYAPLRLGPGSKRLTVLLVLVKRSILDAHLASLQQFGIKAASVSISSVGLTNLILGTIAKEKTGLLILADLTAKGLEIAALRDGGLLYSRESVRGDGESLRGLFTRELRLAAEKIRLEPEDSIENIYLAGEGCVEAQNELREDLPDCELLGGRVQFEMPVENRSRLNEAAAALGLAYSGLMRRPPVRMNLLPRELRTQQTRWAYVPTVILGVALLGLLLALGMRQMFQERILVRKLDQEIQSLRVRVNRVQALRTESETLKSQVQRVESQLRQRDMNLEVLQELTKLLPPDTFLNVYMNKQGAIEISGSGSSPDLIPKLEASPLLMGVQQRGTVYKDAQTGKDRFNFTMKLER